MKYKVPRWCKMPRAYHQDGIGGCWGISFGYVAAKGEKYCLKCEFHKSQHKIIRYVQKSANFVRIALICLLLGHVVHAEDRTVELNWRDNSTAETGQRVYSGSIPFDQLPPNVTKASYLLNINVGDTLCFSVTAFDDMQETGPSNEACATVQAQLPPAPTAPSNMRVVLVTSSTLTLQWSDNADNEDMQSIQRVSRGVTSNIAVNPNLTTYQDVELKKNTDYCYRVRAENLGGISPYSNQACAKTLKK